MAKADSREARAATPARVASLGLSQSLEFKLGLLFLLALMLLATGAYFASRTLVKDKLLDESFRYEQESGLRLSVELRALIGDAEALAGALANLATDPDLKLDQLRNAGPALVRNRLSSALVESLGIWPEPNKLPGAADRSSLYWLRSSSGDFSARSDYNDARSAPYTRERWYTPARFVAVGNGVWSDRRLEPLSNHYVLTYSVPIRQGNNFVGVATVSIDAAALDQRFSALATVPDSYAVLLDGGQRLIAATANAHALFGSQAPLGTTLASLAKSQPDYSPLAIAAFKHNEAQRLKITQSKRYDAKQVSALKDGTRELSRQEAEDILSAIWVAELPAGEQADSDRTGLENDPILKEMSWASNFDLVHPAWTLLRVTPADSGYTGASYLFRQSLVVTLGLVTLTLVLAFFALRALVIRPLRQMIDQLAGTHSIEDALNVVLDASSRNEVGMLAHWQNERIRQLREAMDNTRAARSQMANEVSERKNAQEQLGRVQDRAALAMQSVSDAVVITDEHGRIEDMNLAAEALCGMTLRESRGQTLTDVVRLQLEDAAGYQNLALLAMEGGIRLDYSEGLRLFPHSASAREIILNGSPLRSRNRMMGAVLVFRERGAIDTGVRNEATVAAHRHQQDLLTGLATRALCERRLTLLVEQARASGLCHGLIFVDVDHLKRINDSGGQVQGDDVLVRVAETLAEAAPVAGDVYRIAADQFVVLAESIDAESLAALAEHLRARLAGTRFYWESQYFSVTASFGTVILDRDMPSPVEAVRRADDACAAAKRMGRNCVQHYEPRMDRVGRIVDDDTWVRCIKRGLSEGLFHLRTQWIMPGKDYAGEGQVYEVLLALEDEEGFWASPAAFMPVAERHHLTPAIDRWVIGQTVRHLENHPELVEAMAFCCVNLTTASIADPEFLDFITDCVQRQPQLAAKLCFELREPSLAEHPREAALCCDVLHRMGCKLSIDHYFGRNLADLTLLRKLPIDFIKLDAQGFKSLGSDAVEQMLAESILRIVRHLRRRIIVNNIDDAGMMETWKKLGADYFQGYAFAKPTPVPFLAPD